MQRIRLCRLEVKDECVVIHLGDRLQTKLWWSFVSIVMSWLFLKALVNLLQIRTGLPFLDMGNVDSGTYNLLIVLILPIFFLMMVIIKGLLKTLTMYPDYLTANFLFDDRTHTRKAKECRIYAYTGNNTSNPKFSVSSKQLNIDIYLPWDDIREIYKRCSSKYRWSPELVSQISKLKKVKYRDEEFWILET